MWGWGNCLKYLKRVWNRTEGRGHKDFKKGGHAGSRGGYFKKGDRNHLTNYGKECIFQAKDIIMFLDEVQVINQLVEIWKRYMASELFITELECLTHFNSHMTFVNCVEQFSHGFVILPKLCSDLHKSKKSIWKNLRWTMSSVAENMDFQTI